MYIVDTKYNEKHAPLYTNLYKLVDTQFGIKKDFLIAYGGWYNTDDMIKLWRKSYDMR